MLHEQPAVRTILKTNRQTVEDMSTATRRCCCCSCLHFHTPQHHSLRSDNDLQRSQEHTNSCSPHRRHRHMLHCSSTAQTRTKHSRCYSHLSITRQHMRFLACIIAQFVYHQTSVSLKSYTRYCCSQLTFPKLEKTERLLVHFMFTLSCKIMTNYGNSCQQRSFKATRLCSLSESAAVLCVAASNAFETSSELIT